MGFGAVQPGHLILLVLYFVPTFVAIVRRTGIARRVFVLNLVLGLTGVGWIVLLIWVTLRDVQPIRTPSDN
jgi:hypothetical protein